MSSPPYQRIAVASAFSPRFEQVLAEAKRVRERLGTELHLIYAGARDAESDRRFATALEELDLPCDAPIHYQEGTPAEAILAAIAANKVELIVAGALEKEVILRPFLGNVARQLLREARCSVLLFTKPEREPQPLRCVAFFVPDYSEHSRAALQQTFRLAEAEQSGAVHIIRVYTTFDAARATLRANIEATATGQPTGRTLEEEEVALEDFITSAGPTDRAVESRCIRGNTGFAASDFVQGVRADLLVVPVEPRDDADPFPPHIAWVIDAIPCNLWVIR